MATTAGSRNNYLVLSPGCVLKSLETPSVYNVENDDLYELSEEAFALLQRLPTLARESDINEEFLDFCLKEGILAYSDEPAAASRSTRQSPVPSLRYLEMNITDHCNLACSHCYLGAPRSEEMPLPLMTGVMEEFASMQGLRLLITGGEPLLHSEFWELNEQVGEYPFRSVLLSNGTLITEEIAGRLRVHEVQVSIDGWKESHERLRGKGTFDQAMRGIDYLLAHGITVSIATMVHPFNVGDFERLEKYLQEIGVSSWNVDVPCLAGRMADHPDLSLPPQQAAAYLKYGFGEGPHASGGDHVCGAHLCAVFPDGKVCKCGFFAEEPAGMIQNEGLRTCWERIPRLTLEELKCDCDQIKECRGGCRYRALLFQDLYARDPVQCFARGVLP